MERKRIPLGSKARAQLQGLIENQEKLQAHINSFLGGVSSALEVPDGWTFDLVSMSFIPPIGVTPELEDEPLKLADLQD